MNSSLYYLLLGLDESATDDELKQAYRRMVRLHHPDRFPPEERELQRWKMVQINEAYAGLKRWRSSPDHGPFPQGREANEGPGRTGAGPIEGEPGPNALGFARDPAYVYYKQGFVHFSKAIGGMMDRERHKLTADSGGLRRALYSLGEFHRAHGYFTRVAAEFPDSIWKADAEYKLRRIEGFNRVYHRIRRNLAARAASESPDAQPA